MKTMKTMKLALMCMATALLMISCGSDDPVDPVTPDNSVSVTDITLDKSDLALIIGATEALTATVSPDNATDKNVTWSSSAPAIAEVDAEGKVTGKAEGTAVIIATTVDGGKTATCNVTVAANRVPVTEVTLNMTSLTLWIDETEILIATVLPGDATNKEVTWQSSAPSIADVDDAGKVTAKAEGPATITATTADGGMTATCVVTVTIPGAEYGIQAVKIPAGTFMMGSPTNEPNRSLSEVQHSVTLTEDFWMSKYEITNAQYATFLNAIGVDSAGAAVVGEYGSQTLVETHQLGVVYIDGEWKPRGDADNPVINVTWYGAAAFAEWVDGALPTEAQWEYACRAGTTTSWATATGAENELPAYAWYSVNSGNATHEVGGKVPNAYGLYDMLGNAAEWCADWHANLPADAVTDPKGPASGTYRISRGGGFNTTAVSCRSAARSASNPSDSAFGRGFRVAFPAR